MTRSCYHWKKSGGYSPFSKSAPAPPFPTPLNTGVLLVSNGKILCDLICACSNDSHEYTLIRYTHELDTLMN